MQLEVLQVRVTFFTLYEKLSVCVCVFLLAFTDLVLMCAKEHIWSRERHIMLQAIFNVVFEFTVTKNIHFEIAVTSCFDFFIILHFPVVFSLSVRSHLSLEVSALFSFLLFLFPLISLSVCSLSLSAPGVSPRGCIIFVLTSPPSVISRYQSAVFSKHELVCFNMKIPFNECNQYQDFEALTLHLFGPPPTPLFFSSCKVSRDSCSED